MPRMLLFLLGLVLSIPIAIVVNLLTPLLLARFDRRSAARRKRQVASIRDDLARMATLRSDPSAAVGNVGRRLLPPLTTFAYTVLFNVVALVLGTQKGEAASVASYACAAVGFMLLIAAAVVTVRAAAFCRGLYDPAWHSQQAEKQLRRLGAEGTGEGRAPGEAAPA